MAITLFFWRKRVMYNFGFSVSANAKNSVQALSDPAKPVA
jgi:hypothetical protein